jgi:hypothetical protein
VFAESILRNEAANAVDDQELSKRLYKLEVCTLLTTDPCFNYSLKTIAPTQLPWSQRSFLRLAHCIAVVIAPSVVDCFLFKLSGQFDRWDSSLPPSCLEAIVLTPPDKSVPVFQPTVIIEIPAPLETKLVPSNVPCCFSYDLDSRDKNTPSKQLQKVQYITISQMQLKIKSIPNRICADLGFSRFPERALPRCSTASENFGRYASHLLGRGDWFLRWSWGIRSKANVIPL